MCLFCADIYLFMEEKMKKFLAMLLALCMVFALCAVSYADNVVKIGVF